jgi:hypothetical protein
MFGQKGAGGNRLLLVEQRTQHHHRVFWKAPAPLRGRSARNDEYETYPVPAPTAQPSCSSHTVSPFPLRLVLLSLLNIHFCLEARASAFYFDRSGVCCWDGTPTKSGMSGGLGYKLSVSRTRRLSRGPKAIQHSSSS